MLKQKLQHSTWDCGATRNRLAHGLPPNIYPTNLQVLLTESSGQWWWHWQDSFFCAGAAAVLSPSSFLGSMLSLPELRKGMLARKLSVNIRGGKKKNGTVLGWTARLEMEVLQYIYPSKFEKVFELGLHYRAGFCRSLWNGHCVWGLLGLSGIRSKIPMFKFFCCQRHTLCFSDCRIQLFSYCITQVKSLVTPLCFLCLYTWHTFPSTESHKNERDLWYSRQSRIWPCNSTKL